MPDDDPMMSWTHDAPWSPVTVIYVAERAVEISVCDKCGQGLTDNPMILLDGEHTYTFHRACIRSPGEAIEWARHHPPLPRPSSAVTFDTEARIELKTEGG